MAGLPLRTKIAKAEDLWEHALLALDEQDRQSLKCLTNGRLETLDSILQLAQDKKALCIRKRWKISVGNGKVIILRDVFEKIATWVRKFKEVGDVAVQYDPAHASLPWAAVRMLLQVTINDSDCYGTMVDGLETVTSVITRFAIVESVHLTDVSPAASQLRASTVELYTALLQFTVRALHYFDSNTLIRVAKASLPSKHSDIQALLLKLRSLERTALDDSRLITAERQKDMAKNIQILQQQTGASSQQQIAAPVTEDELIETFNKQTSRLLDMFKLLESPLLHLQSQITEIQDGLNQSQRSAINLWLSTIPYTHHHQSMREGRLEGSGAWLREHEIFDYWQRASHSSVLWLHGIPGCGKSRLMSTVVDYLQELNSMQLEFVITIAYFYCSISQIEPERSDPCQILRSIAAQLSSKGPYAPIRNSTQTFYNRAKSQSHIPRPLNVAETTELIIQLLEDQKAFILVDGLDECNPTQRHELLDSLKHIVNSATNSVRILVSSRDDSDIVVQLEDTANLYIQAQHNQHDINRYVDFEVDTAISKKRLLKGNVSPNLRERITHILKTGSQGMFRWVALQLQSICNSRRMKHEKDILNELEHPPKDLLGLYDSIYLQILELPVHSRTMAEQALKLLRSAQRPLRTPTFIEAICIDQPGTIDITPQYVLDITCNLLTIDHSQNIFRFAHLSVVDYLDSRAEFNSDEIHELAALKCLHKCQELGLEDWSDSTDSRDSFNRFREYLRCGWFSAAVSMLSQYARDYWPLHCSLVSLSRRESLLSSIIRSTWITHSTRFEKWKRGVEVITGDARMPIQHTYPLLSRIPASVISPFYLGFSYGLIEFFESLPSQSIVEQNQELRVARCSYCRRTGLTGLHLAITYGYETAVECLLKRGINPNEFTLRHETPLQIAAQNDQAQLISLLVQYGADPNMASSAIIKDNTAIREGARSGVGFRQRNGAVTRLGQDADSPLHHAASYGNTECIRELLRFGAHIDARSSFGLTPLHKAISGNQLNAIESLIDEGASLEIAIQPGMRPLHYAAARGQAATVQLLIKRGANPYAHDNLGKTPYEMAILYDHPEVASILRFAKPSNLEDTHESYVTSLYETSLRRIDSLSQNNATESDLMEWRRLLENSDMEPVSKNLKY